MPERPFSTPDSTPQAGGAATYEAPRTIGRMLVTTWSLLYSLGPELRAEAEFPMSDRRRLDWDFIPKPDRAGVPLAALDRHQRVIAHSLLQAGLSTLGYSQALSIMAMENILREREVARHGVVAGDFRNADLYHLAFFGRPGFEDTWGWRLLGHHVCLNYTIVGQRYLTVTPCNMGAQPATAGVIAPLAREEQLALSVLEGMGAHLRDRAVIHPVAPADFATRQVARVGRVELPDYYDLGLPAYTIDDADREALKFERDRPAGVPASELSADGAAALLALVRCYFGRLPDEVAESHAARLDAEDLERVHFAWAGAPSLDDSHYYRIQTPHTLIELVNSIDNGNHIHSVLRDLDNDLGHDLLLAQAAAEKAHGHHLDTRLRSTLPAD